MQKFSPDAHQVVNLKVFSGQLTLLRSTEARLHRENVRDLQLSPHGDTGRLLLALTIRETAVLKAEEVTKLRHKVREKSGCMRCLLRVVSIHENVLLATVPVQVTIKHDFALFAKLPNQAFYS